MASLTALLPPSTMKSVVITVIVATIVYLLRRKRINKEVSSSPVSSSPKVYAEQRAWRECSSLCSKCSALMESRRSILAEFEAISDYDKEIEALEKQLDVTHRICHICESRVQQKLLDEDKWLRPQLLNFTLHKSKHFPVMSKMNFFSKFAESIWLKSSKDWILDALLLLTCLSYALQSTLEIEETLVTSITFCVLSFLLTMFGVKFCFRSNRFRSAIFVLVAINCLLCCLEVNESCVAYLSALVAFLNFMRPSKTKSSKFSRKRRSDIAPIHHNIEAINNNYLDCNQTLVGEQPKADLYNDSKATIQEEKDKFDDESPATSCDISALSICSSDDEDETPSIRLNSSLSKSRSDIIRPARFVAPSPRKSWVAGGYWDTSQKASFAPDSVYGKNKTWSQSSCSSSGFVSFSHHLRPSTPLNVFASGLGPSETLLRTSSPRPSGLFTSHDVSHNVSNFFDDNNSNMRMHREQLSLSIGAQNKQDGFMPKDDKKEMLNESFLDRKVSVRSLLLHFSLIANVVAVFFYAVVFVRSEV